MSPACAEYCNTDPTWSPDSRWIAFNSERDGNSEIYLMRPDGSAQSRLTQNDRVDERPAWSPDSRKLAFSWRTRADAGIMILNVRRKRRSRQPPVTHISVLIGRRMASQSFANGSNDYRTNNLPPNNRWTRAAVACFGS